MAAPQTQIAELTAAIAEIDKAILATAGGSSYSIGGRSLTRQDVDSLRSQRSQYVRELKQARAVLEGASDPGTAVAVFYR